MYEFVESICRNMEKMGADSVEGTFDFERKGKTWRFKFSIEETENDEKEER